jgi:hypothetical protein
MNNILKDAAHAAEKNLCKMLHRKNNSNGLKVNFESGFLFLIKTYICECHFLIGIPLEIQSQK